MLSLGCISQNRLAVTVSQIKCRQLFSRTRDRNLIKTSNIFCWCRVHSVSLLKVSNNIQSYTSDREVLTCKCKSLSPKLSSFVVKILILSNNVKDSAVQSNKASKEAANIGILNKKKSWQLLNFLIWKTFFETLGF